MDSMYRFQCLLIIIILTLLGTVSARARRHSASHKSRESSNSTGPELEWTVLDELGPDGPTKRQGHTITVINDKLLVFGGCFLDVTCYNDLFEYDTNLKQWRSTTDLFTSRGGTVIPAPRGFHTASIPADGMLYIVGGSSPDGYRSDAFRLDPETLIWDKPQIEGAAPAGREGHSAVVYGKNKIFIFGGYGDDGYMNDVVVLDTALMVWANPPTGGDIPSPRAGHSATLLGNYMYVFGGSSDLGVSDELYVFDLAFLSWSKPLFEGGAPAPRHHHMAIPINHQIWFFGGCDPSQIVCFNDTIVLSTARKTWGSPSIPLNSAVSDVSFSKHHSYNSWVYNAEPTDIDAASATVPFFPRESHAGGLVDDVLYVFGGSYLGRRAFYDFLTYQIPTKVKLSDTVEFASVSTTSAVLAEEEPKEIESFVVTSHDEGEEREFKREALSPEEILSESDKKVDYLKHRVHALKQSDKYLEQSREHLLQEELDIEEFGSREHGSLVQLQQMTMNKNKYDDRRYNSQIQQDSASVAGKMFIPISLIMLSMFGGGFIFFLKGSVAHTDNEKYHKEESGALLADIPDTPTTA